MSLNHAVNKQLSWSQGNNVFAYVSIIHICVSAEEIG